VFPSRTRELNYPQFEHARQAAWLAGHWGNSIFPAPPIDKELLVRGVLLHDRGYGWLDNDPLLQISDQRRAEIYRSGLHGVEDPVVEQIVQLHLRRLMDGSTDPATQALLAQQPPIVDPTMWRWVDSVTNLCDRLSFEFCFEVPSDKSVLLTPGPDDSDAAQRGQPYTVEFRYGRTAGGELFCSPWPFCEMRVEGQMLGYDRAGYPEILVPRLINYSLRPG
jgi:hypothetical protein